MAKQIGVITAMSGKVFARSPDGKVRELELNSPVYETDTISGTATISLDSGSIDVSGVTNLDNSVTGESIPTAKESAVQSGTADEIIKALDRGADLNETLDATAAGLGSGGDGGGNSFVVLARILETVGRNAYGYNFNPLGVPEITEGVGEATSTTISEQPEVPDVPEVPNPPKEPETPEDPKEPEDPKDPPKDPEDPEDPVDDGKGNNGHGNNTDGQDDDNPGKGGGGPNSDPKDGEDEDEKPKTDDSNLKDSPKGEDGVGDEEEEGTSTEPDEDSDKDDSETDDEVEPDDKQDSGPSEPPKDGEDEDDNPKEHQDNGKGNGVDDAPGGSGDTKGDDADGSNTEGTKDTLNPKDILDDGEDEIPLPKGNNGFGNGDQSAPGNSGPHNGAENDLTLNLHQPSIEELLKQHGNPHYD